MNVYPQHGPDPKVVVEMTLSEVRDWQYALEQELQDWEFSDALDKAIEQLEGNNG